MDHGFIKTLCWAQTILGKLQGFLIKVDGGALYGYEGNKGCMWGFFLVGHGSNEPLIDPNWCGLF